MNDIETLRHWVEESENIVFFGGAGVSTESGIPDFRSQDGLYHQHYDLPPETILSHDYFMSHTQEFYRFYRDKMLCLDVQPNAANLALAKLEQLGKLKAVVTQNIDGLHQKAGSQRVYELHGSVYRNYCMPVGPRTRWRRLQQERGFPAVPTAAVSSSRMWYSIRRGWTSAPSEALWRPLPMPICSL